MDATLLMYRGGVRSLGKKTLADGKAYELFFKARTPAELTSFLARISATESIEDVEKRVAAVSKAQIDFIAASMCQDDGEPLLTREQAAMVPLSLRNELQLLIVKASNELVDPDLPNA